MGKAEKIKAEIDRLQSSTLDENCNFKSQYDQGIFDGLSLVDNFIDSLEEERQKERMLNNVIEREVKVDAGGYPYIDVTELYDYDKDRPLAKKGDKVKLIIIMEE